MFNVSDTFLLLFYTVIFNSSDVQLSRSIPLYLPLVERQKNFDSVPTFYLIKSVYQRILSFNTSIVLPSISSQNYARANYESRIKKDTSKTLCLKISSKFIQ